MQHNTDFKTLSYNKHIEMFDALGGKEDDIKLVFASGTTAAWRHKRVCGLINPIIECDPGSEWLTIGDGRWGRDAKYLQDKGCRVVATDITDTLLKEAENLGYIT